MCVDTAENKPSKVWPAYLPLQSNETAMWSREDHDLEPPRGRDGLKRRKAARRNVGELQVLRDGEVARETDASLNRDDVEESEHRRASVLDFHDLVTKRDKRFSRK